MQYATWKQLFDQLDRIEQKQEKIMANVVVDSAQIASLLAAFASLKTDISAALADLAAKAIRGNGTSPTETARGAYGGPNRLYL